MIARLIAILFLSREVAHRAHLNTKSYAQHMALGSFYDDIIDPDSINLDGSVMPAIGADQLIHPYFPK